MRNQQLDAYAAHARTVHADLTRLREDALTTRERALLETALSLSTALLGALGTLDTLQDAPVSCYRKIPDAPPVFVIPIETVRARLTNLLARLQPLQLPPT